MKALRMIFNALGVVLFVFALQAPAQAQQFQVYVASNGNDVGNCDRAAPCRQISYALTQVASNGFNGGTVVALDSGSYEPFVVSKSVSVVAAPGVFAEINVNGAGNGVYISASSSDTVVLRGLALKGDKNVNNVTYGIKVDYVRAAHIENCVISGFHQGIRFLVVNGKLLVKDTTVMNNLDVGIFINSESASSLSVASIEHCRVVENIGVPSPTGQVFSGIGIWARKNVKVTVRDTETSNNTLYGLTAGYDKGSNATVVMENCAVTDNGYTGINASWGSKIFVSTSTIAFNHGFGFHDGATTGEVYTRRNNTVEDNGGGPGVATPFPAR